MEVAEIKGRCPIYKRGDKVVMDPVSGESVSRINLKETDGICTHALGTGAFLTYTLWFEHAKPAPDDDQKLPWTRALGPSAFKCPMVGPPYSKCGYVVFKGRGVPQRKE
jgi:hypothetical protein